MAGAAGVEPANARVKVSCLTAWPRPNARSQRVAPVSYTHLDVYKRQEYGSTVAGKLQGKYIVSYGRTCDLIYLVFSDDASDHGKGGGMALHIQCGLRIVQGDQLVVCNEEMYVPREGASQQEIDDFAWDEPNARYDETMKRFMEGPARKVLQAKVHAWEIGRAHV